MVGENEVVKRNVSGLSYEVPYSPCFYVKQGNVTSDH